MHLLWSGHGKSSQLDRRDRPNLILLACIPKAQSIYLHSTGTNSYVKCVRYRFIKSVVRTREVTHPSHLHTLCAFSRRPMIPLHAHRPPGQHSKHIQQNALLVPNWCAIFQHLSECTTPRSRICKSIEGRYHWRFYVSCASIGRARIQSAVTMFLQKCGPFFCSPSGTN